MNTFEHKLLNGSTDTDDSFMSSRCQVCSNVSGLNAFSRRNTVAGLAEVCEVHDMFHVS